MIKNLVLIGLSAASLFLVVAGDRYRASGRARYAGPFTGEAVDGVV